MSYEDHLKTCDSCRKRNPLKPTISIKSASSYRKQKSLVELGAIIRGISYPSLESIPIEREVKLRELGKMVRGR
jgi:hypothetical protein